jgi:hypothetical protein
MTRQEFEYIRRAMEAIESPECSTMSKVKIQRTMSQILMRSADRMEQEFVDRYYQHTANDHPVKVLQDA